MTDTFRRRVQDLLETTNRYLDRARSAEANASFYQERLKSWKASFGRALEMASEARLELSLLKLDFDRCAKKWRADTIKIADERDDARRKLVDLQAEHDRLCSRNDHLSYRVGELETELHGRREVQHLKRGSYYRVLGDLSFQLAKPEHDDLITPPYSKIREGTAITVYRSEDGKLYGRFPDEFEDGRFKTIGEPSNGEA